MFTPFRILTALALGLLSNGFALAQAVTFVSTQADWKLFRGTTSPSPGSPLGWTQRTFNDTSWTTEKATFFYGEEGYSGTDLTGMSGAYNTIFLRHRFSIVDPKKVSELELRVVCDDGFVAYLNGQRVASVNASLSDPTFDSLATGNVTEPVSFQNYPLATAASALIAGENVLSVAVLNVSPSSSDLVFDAELTARDLTPSPPTLFSVDPTPGLVTNLTQIRVIFSEIVTGVSADHFLVNGRPATSVTGKDAVYTFTFPQPAYGLVSLGWGALHTVKDLETPPLAFSQTAPGSIWAYELLDPNGPAIVGRQPAPGTVLRHLGEVVVLFNRPVKGLESADLTLNGQPATGVSGIGAGPYRFQFTPSATAGLATVAWVANHGLTSDEPEPHPFNGGSWSYSINPGLPAPQVVINEILADNQGGLKDEEGDPEDWIELWNQGTTPVNLGGWALSDGNDPENEWVLPPVELPANGFLLVWASGKDRAGTGPRREWHTHFKLNPNGDRLRLLGPELPRPVQDEVEFTTQGPDYSFGRQVEANTIVGRYFAVPSPLATNGLSSITNRTADVHFSVERGYFDSPFRLSLACETPSATIRYTTNGSPPVAPNGFLYSGPVLINASRVIRAAAVAPDQLPSSTRTHTYLYGLPSSRRSLPAISLVTATNNLFGRSGIMESNPRNTNKRGPAWERPVSVEYLEPEGNGGFQVNAGLRLQGGDYIRGLYNYRVTSLPESKYSFRLYFRGEYGEGRLKQQLFPKTTIASFDTVVLRAGMNDHSNPFLKDEVVRQLSSNLGQTASHGTFVHLFLNGVYRGYYNPTERIDVDFLQAYHGGGEKWDVIAQMGEVREGDGSSWSSLMSLAQTRPATNMANHLEFARRMDLTNFVDYLLPNIYVDADDWPHNNWRAAHEAVPEGKWRFYVWDAEWSFGQPNGHSTSFNTITSQLSTLSPPWGTTEIQRLFNALKRGREFQMLFSDRVHRALFNGGALADANVRSTYEETKSRLNTARTVSGFNNSTINNWINGRRRHVLGHLGTAGFNRSTNAPGLNQFGGAVPAGFSLVLTNVSGPIYYTTDGSDPRSAFTEAVSPTAQIYTSPLILAEPMQFKARSLVGTTNWSALTETSFQIAQVGPSLRFTELMYNPPGGEAYEFVELSNLGGTPVDLSGFSFDGIIFRFPIPFVALPPGSRLVLASEGNPTAFATRYPGVAVAGHFGGSLSNGGERVALLNREGQVVESVTYSDGEGWPVAADGSGRSLERSNLSGDPDAPATWQASALSAGTPGQANSPAILPVLRLNEVSAQAPPGTDWIELYNSGTSLLNLSHWSLTDDSSNPRKFVFPTGTQIAAGGFLVVTCDPDSAGDGLQAPFNLDSDGEQIALFNASTNVIDTLDFGSQARGFTTIRSGIEAHWTLGEPTPGSLNETATTVGAEGVRLNEFLADSDTGTDWIELHNPSTLPTVLTGGYLSRSNALFRVSAPAFIGPGGFAVLKADEEVGADHVDFKLPAAGGLISWHDLNGVVVDRVDYSAQLPLVSTGRLPESIGVWTAFPWSATPGASNYLAALGATLRLNEFLAINAGITTAPDGSPADWIELHNSQSNALSLAGFRFQVNNGPKWTFPAGVQLAADAHLLVWATDRILPGTLNLGQSLSNRGGILSVFDTQNRLLDRIEYGFQITNQSVGRSAETWSLLTTATPGQLNSAPWPTADSSAVRFNEWLVSAGPEADWIELFNPSAAPVDLGGHFLTDDPSVSGLTNFLIAPLSFIPAGGFVRFFADGDLAAGPDHVSFRLDELGETIRLSNPARGLIDQVDFIVQLAGVSEGRFPDGTSRITRLPWLSPLAFNGGAEVDLDGDGLPDVWEFGFNLNPDDSMDATLDGDWDGFDNRQEFAAGTDPTNAASRLSAGTDWDGGFKIRFTAAANRSYSVLYLDGRLAENSWQKLSDVPAAGSNRDVAVPDTTPEETRPVRWYRVVTPALP